MIKGNDGAVTPGSRGETLDGMRIERIQEISKLLRSGGFKWEPARRIFIPKPGKTELRPLDIRAQKVVQKAIDMILQILWEEGFSNHSHGYRPGRSPATAIDEIKT